MISDFKRLKVWDKSIDFAVAIYKVTKKFPRSELYGLTSQLRRASVSISSNIAEGCGKPTKKDFTRFLYNSYGSIKEIESQLIISKRLQYIDDQNLDMLNLQCVEISKMVFGLIRGIDKKT